MEKSIKTVEALETQMAEQWEIQQCEYPNESNLSVSEVGGEVLRIILVFFFLYILNSLTFAHLFIRQEHLPSIYNTYLYSTFFNVCIFIESLPVFSGKGVTSKERVN